MHRVRSILLFLLIALAVAYPPLASFQRQGIAAPFKYFAPDTFYYLAIADHSVNIPNYTYDGIYPTNGFHPLWEYLLTAAFGHFDALNNQPNQILFVFFSSIILAAIGAGLIGVALLRLTGNFPLTLLSILPGAYWIFFSHLNPHYGAIWSFINGMESPLSIFLFGVLLVMLINMRMLASPSPAAIATVSAVMTLMTLSRLDDIFILLPFCGYIVWMAKDRRERLRSLAAGCAIPAIAIGGYMLYNLGYAGTAIPLSGLSKGGLSLSHALHDLIGVILPIAPFANHDVWEDLTLRALQMAIPVGIGILWVLKLVRDWRKRHEAFLTTTHYMHMMVGILCGYAITKGLYNFINVAPWNQGHWYYPLSIITCNIVCAVFLRSAFAYIWRPDLFEFTIPLRSGGIASPAPIILIFITGILLCCIGTFALAGVIHSDETDLYDIERLVLPGAVFLVGLAALLMLPTLVDRIRGFARFRPPITIDCIPLLAIIGALVVMSISANVYVHMMGMEDHGNRYYRLWSERASMTDKFRSWYDGTGIVEFDDGILSYSLGMPAMNGIGLALDHEAYREYSCGRLLDIAYGRGFRAFATLAYMNIDSAACANADTLLIRIAGFPFLAHQSLDRWRFSVMGRDTRTGIALIGFSPGPRGS